jgi:hypothetical protein
MYLSERQLTKLLPTSKTSMASCPKEANWEKGNFMSIFLTSQEGATAVIEQAPTSML